MYISEDCKVRITIINCMFFDALQTQTSHGVAFDNAAPFGRGRAYSMSMI